MSQTKVKSRMYASKLLTERSPVAKCVMIAEASMDAPKTFCDKKSAMILSAKGASEWKQVKGK